MSDAVYNTLRIEIEAGSPGEKQQPYLFRASGSVLKFKGFLAIYEEARDEDTAPDEDEGRILPDIEEGRWMRLLRLLPEQHWTQPPPRYTEASLVKTLEEYGIGRPSTYAPIISTIQQRGYVTREDKRLVPTETGEVVNDLLVEFFPDVLNVAFTASMEEKLDEIAEGHREWVPMMHEFYEPFAKQLKYADEHMPETRKEETIDRDCPKCGSSLIVRWGRYGKFIGCSNYPDCRHTEPWLEKIGVKCPQCDTGEMVERRTRKGRVFYGCSNYPDCEFTTWKRPLPQPCPKCGGMLEEKRKDTAACTQCDFQGRIDKLPEVDPVAEEKS
jgi:DNA topoisomerase-1